MSMAWRRIAAVGLIAVGIGATGYALSSRLGSDSSAHDHSTHSHGTVAPNGTDGADDGAHGATADSMVHLDHGGAIGGASATVDGVTLIVLAAPTATSDAFTFRLERDGAAITDFQENHGAVLHLLAIRNDLAEFHHVHPTIGEGGVWSVELPLRTPGSYRIVTDVKPAGAPAAISPALDVVIAGIGPREPLPAAVLELDVDGLRVVRDGFEFTVAPADSLEPYLGQPAHLVGFRQGDLAYLHLHAESGDGGVYRFVEPPGDAVGAWRFFLQFGNDGAVVTAPFTVSIS
jgi:hypothetical protein